MRQEERRARTRRQLLDAARAAFAARGYEGGSLDAIAASAGLSKGAVYAHFPTKLHLYTAVIDELLSEAKGRAGAVADALRKGDRPDAAARRYLRGDASDAEHAALLMDAWTTATREPEVRALLDAYLAERHALLAAAAIDEGARPEEALALAAVTGRLIDAEVLHERHGGSAGSVARAHRGA
ncbi:MAG: hypothetical protein KatS3mg064_0501 [Tepidiforma sp.]|nr:TetR/AcrR family transcriptional regulator [Tepidiforma sp.]GIW17344.1 MAG: hypothetical protein KatS3mg064_0501 [Tepidiforma sp.]